MKKFACPLFLFVFHLSLNVYSQVDKDFNCFTILAGKDATSDGSVFVAHNEDNYGEIFADWHKVPRIKHKPGTYHCLLSGDSIAEIEETNAYLWITVSTYNAEQYLNEWGVTITTDASHSKVTDEEGNIGQSLRRIMAERSHTSREAVQIAGKLVEKFGYIMSGRIYSVADPNEAWVLEVVKGKHWVAARVPDDEVVLVPNYYVIAHIDLRDTVNFMASPGVIEYAVDKGWYDSSSGKPFNFRKAYCTPDRLNSMTNIARRWAALNILSEKQYEIYDEFPFSFKPKHKISIHELMSVMQNHYEGTEFEMHPAYNNGDPHKNTTTMRICSKRNTFGTVVQLRNWLTVEIGCVMWIAPRYPCIQPYIPWYYGIKEIPAGYENETYQEALDNYLNKDRNLRQLYPEAGFWSFVDYAALVEKNFSRQIKSVRISKLKLEERIFGTISDSENEISKIYQSDPEKACILLTDLTKRYAEKALARTRNQLKQSCYQR